MAWRCWALPRWVARGYSERKGIVYATWREAGVPPAVLAKAGISRTSA